MSRKTEIYQEYTFRSKSSPGKVYTTILYVDGTASCNCPGWTLRVREDGSRFCKHLIACGLVPIGSSAVANGNGPAAAKASTGGSAARQMNTRAAAAKAQQAEVMRRFALDD